MPFAVKNQSAEFFPSAVIGVVDRMKKTAAVPGVTYMPLLLNYKQKSVTAAIHLYFSDMLSVAGMRSAAFDLAAVFFIIPSLTGFES